MKYKKSKKMVSQTKAQMHVRPLLQFLKLQEQGMPYSEAAKWMSKNYKATGDDVQNSLADMSLSGIMSDLNDAGLLNNFYERSGLPADLTSDAAGDKKIGDFMARAWMNKGRPAGEGMSAGNVGVGILSALHGLLDNEVPGQKPRAKGYSQLDAMRDVNLRKNTATAKSKSIFDALQNLDQMNNPVGNFIRNVPGLMDAVRENFEPYLAQKIFEKLPKS
jgi:hypothetical protein